MTVHVLIPVFNRLAMTQTLIEQLHQQIVDEPLTITVVDDGSTDGTAEFLRNQPNIQTLTGNGTLWWGGAIDLGLRHILPMTNKKDWILLANNDTEIKTDFIQRLLDVARQYSPAAVGSVVRHIQAPHKLLSIGPKIDPWRFLIEDIVETEKQEKTECQKIDALSGRGVLYPACALKAVKGVQARWLPHYLCDYEISLRVRKQGWQLLAALDATVYSLAEFGNTYQAHNLHDRFFSVRSPSYLPALIAFWWHANGFFGKITLPFRIVLHFLLHRLNPRKKKTGY